MWATANAPRRSQSLLLLSLAAAVGCGATDHLVGSLFEERAAAGASGATNVGGPSESAGAGGEGATNGEGATSGEGASPSESAGASGRTSGTTGGAGGDGDNKGDGNGGASNLGGAPACAPGSADCVQSTCGDGIESSTEQCDDGNTVDGDGCSAICSWEPLQGQPQGPPYQGPVAISGDTIVMGPFVFRLHDSLWRLEAKLTAGAAGGGSDLFDDPNPPTMSVANRVAISGDTIAIGALGDDEAAEDAGAVHIFQRTGSTWAWQQKLLPSLPDGTVDAIASEHFGWQLAFSGDTLAVGAPDDDDQGVSSGSVYVFRRAAGGFNPEAKLGATLPSGNPDGDAHLTFGMAVSLAGNRIVAGSQGRTAGAAYVFDRSGAVWAPLAKLVPTLPDGTSDAKFAGLFGAAVAVAGDTIVVGDPWGSSTGAVYIFENGTQGFAAAAKFQVPASPFGPAGALDFGISTAISSTGNTILIGSDLDQHAAGYYPGSGYVYKRAEATWTYDSTLLAQIPSPEVPNPMLPLMGTYAAISGDELLLGGDSSSYLFRQKNGTWDTRLVIQISGPEAF